MSNKFYTMFKSTSEVVNVDGIEYGIARLNKEFEDDTIDKVVARGLDNISATMTLSQQIKQTRFYYGSISFALNTRQFTKKKIDVEEQRASYNAGVEINELKGARIWCALATESNIFLGFFIDGNHVLFLNDSITIVDVDTTGDNNGAGYKGGEDTYTTVSLIQNPDIKSTVKSGSYVFDAVDLKDGEVDVPDGYVEIAPFAFQGCEAEHIIIPEGIVAIGRHAFAGCTSLKSISLPSTLTSIGVSAFSGCTSLCEITLPESVTVVDKNTFESCISLKSAILPCVKEIRFCGFDACPNLTHVYMPVIEELGSFAFARASSLEDITLPDTLKVIENAVFKECLSLKKIRIPASVTEFDEDAFFSTDNLEEVEVSSDFYEEFKTLVRGNYFSTHKNFLETVKIKTY